MIIFQCLLFFLLYPLSSVLFIKMESNDSGQLLSRHATRYLQGFAAASVVLGHYVFRLEERGCLLKHFNLISAIGTVSVGVLFFVSGYGIFESHKLKKQEVRYLISKIAHLIIPYWIVGTIGILFDIIVVKEKLPVIYIFLYILGIKNLFWFIWILLGLYIIVFLISQFKISDEKKIIIFIVIILVSGVFMYFLGLQPFWFRNNIFFAIGMIVSLREKDIIPVVRKKYFLILIATFLILVASVGIYLINCELLKILATGLMASGIITVFVVAFQFFSPPKYNFMYFLGNKSIYIYLLHTKFYEILEHFIEMDSVIANIVYFIGLIGLVIVFFYADRMIRKGVNGIKNPKRINNHEHK